MTNRQIFLDKIRDLSKELEGELHKPRYFIKDVEPFMIREAMECLRRAEELKFWIPDKKICSAK